MKTTLIIVLSLIVSSSPSHAMSKAEALAAMYGVLLGHIDGCDITIKQWHAAAMGKQISAAAESAADREQALDFAKQMQRQAVRSPTMSCDEVRKAIEHSESELRNK